MAKAKTDLRRLVQEGCPVFCFCSTEAYLVRRELAAVRALLAGEDPETTLLDGETPGIEEVIAAAGTISFFGTRRVVEMPGLNPARYSDKDVKDLCDALESAENAVFLIGITVEEERGKPKIGKRCKTVLDLCGKIGHMQQLTKPTQAELRQVAVQRAEALGTSLPSAAAAALLERCGEDPFRLENEVDKLCAACGYTTVTPALVAELCAQALEADAYEMARMLAAGNATGACRLLDILLRRQEEPTWILGALAGAYVDLYRVKLGASRGKSYAEVFRDLGYTGNDFRLKRSADTAARYTLPRLEACIGILCELDRQLKGSPIDKRTALTLALCRLAGGETPREGARWRS